MPPLTRARTAAAEAPPTLLDALARAPAAAALVVAALGQRDRKAPRLTHSELRDAVDETVTVLRDDTSIDGAAWPAPTPRRWPRLESLAALHPNLATLGGLGSGTWAALHTLRVECSNYLDAPCAHALAARCGGCPRCASSTCAGRCSRTRRPRRSSTPRAPRTCRACARSPSGARPSRQRRLA
jgi:hypothetical protein